MFLRTLTLKGFKSFADATSLEMEPGVTVVVGPNGSGKSNVVDAIAWVLGAQAPSAVRSQKMDDVIFAGTAKRPALGRAEVSLTIDNSAGLLPIEFSEVTITRTLFRTGDSEYAINGVPCRLLDVQELLSDAGVGRQQHVIISQGQIDAVLNARPEERRLIIEEAAGVLKFRKRKEKAERRLEGTEASLVRIQDLLREVRRQLRPLERQAEAARRHDDLVRELFALKLHLAGREMTGLRARLEANAAEEAELRRSEAEVRRELAALDAEVVATEARLSALGGFDLGDDLTRYESLRERARGIAAVLVERRRSLERDHGRLLDAALVATLEADAARLTNELADVEAAAAALVPDADELHAQEAALEEERREFAAVWGDGPGTPDGRAAEVRGELGGLRAGVEGAKAERERIEARLRALEEKQQRLEAERARRQGELDAAERRRPALTGELAAAEQAVAVAEETVRAAEQRSKDADAERHAWRARADALAQALDEARARAGAERLAGVDGVVGTLLDLVDIDAGWEAAFEAAAGEALGAVVLADVESGRRALRALADGDLSGSVLALGTATGGGSTGTGAVAALPGCEPVRTHVRARRPEVGPLLDRLLADAVAVDAGWEAALDLSLRTTGLVVVTRRGDRFGAAGWRLGASGTGATGAALDEARERADHAAAAAEEAARVLRAARERRAERRKARDELAREAQALDATRRSAADAVARVAGEAAELVAERDALRAHLQELAERMAREEARLAELAAALPALEAEEAAALEEAKRLQAMRARLDSRAQAVAALRTDLEVRAASLEERRQLLRRRLDEVEDRLRRDAVERAEAAARREQVETALRAVDGLARVVAEQLEGIEGVLADLHEQRRRQSEESRQIGAVLDGLRRNRSDAERRLEAVRERIQRVEIDQAELRMRLEAAVETLRRELDAEPETALAAEVPPLPEGTTAVARARELERELKLLGPVNPLALEEHAALSERHAFLESQLEDVRASRRELTRVIKAIDEEIIRVFVAAYADVADNFEKLFATLFPGGQGSLRLTDPENLLSTGIEVEARPSGKNIRKLSLLSGGERSLTALAFLFAVFRSRPSPFYVMDEVEAALDDVNLHRFLDLVREFREEAQLIIVSHQKRTMEAADCLFGVTMQPGGSSRVVSERVTS